MADRNGYIGRAPSDSAVTVSRQSFSPTGVTTDFTFAAGYTPGYFDLFINGVKMIEGSDYTSSDGSTFAVLNGGAQNGDVLEGIAYKAFNAASVTNAGGDFTVGGNLTVNGSATFAGAGTSVAFATTAFALSGTPDVTVRNLTGVAATFTGVVTYEDVTNVDSVGVVTAQSGINIVGGGLTVTGVSTFFNDVTIQDGRLLLGTTTEGAALADNLTVADSGDCGITIRSGTTNYGSIYFSDATSGADEYRGQIEYNHNTDILKFYAGASNKVTINSSLGKTVDITGNVNVSGIATATGVNATGIVTATSFEGSGANLTNLPASGDSNDITACLFI